MYEPREDSVLLSKYVEKYAKGIVLDMGTGSGIQAEKAAKNKKVVKVYAVDVDEEAIKHCIRNQKSKKITFAMSNLFSLFRKDERFKNIKFDTIIFNPPYLPSDPTYPDIALDGGKKGHELICKFLNESKRFLKPKTKILLVFSSLTGKETLDKFLYKKHFKFKELEKENHFFEGIFIYLIENEER